MCFGAPSEWRAPESPVETARHRRANMSEQIDRVLKDLRLKLAEVDDRAETVNARIIGWSTHAEDEVRDELDKVKKRIELGLAQVTMAHADIESWLQAQKNETSEVIAAWKEKREIAKLQNRADKAARYAVAALGVVVAALDEAEQASLEAWLARRDAKSTSARR
jgi:vacuolar-type H+-ATPase subunit I/STV1